MALHHFLLGLRIRGVLRFGGEEVLQVAKGERQRERQLKAESLRQSKITSRTLRSNRFSLLLSSLTLAVFPSTLRFPLPPPSPQLWRTHLDYKWQAKDMAVEIDALKSKVERLQAEAAAAAATSAPSSSVGSASSGDQSSRKKWFGLF